MHLLIDRKKILIYYLVLFVFLSSINNKNIINKFNYFIEIKEIQVIGLDNKYNNLIKKNLTELIDNNIFLLKKKFFFNQFQKYNYIESFKVIKEFPSKLIIHLEPTNIIASTYMDKKKYYLGSNGKLIEENSFKKQTKTLPNIFGNFTPNEFINLFNEMEKKGLNYNDYESFFYFRSGRWDIMSKNNILIKLPKENLGQSLSIVKKILSNNNILYNSIDLRIPNQLILTNVK